MDMSELKQKRGRTLGAMTRVRQRAHLLINSRGSRTQMVAIIAELDQAFQVLEEINDRHIVALDNPEEVEKAKKYIADAECQRLETVRKLEEHLLERKDEPPSVVSGSQRSRTSQRSSVSRRAEIAVKVKQLETQQLQQRHEREKKEQDLRRQHELETSRDAQEAAELEARLTLAAENELSWERRDDFADEQVTLGAQGVLPEHPVSRQNVPSPAHPCPDTESLNVGREPEGDPPHRLVGVLTDTGVRPSEQVGYTLPARVEVQRTGPSPSQLHSLPKLSLPKFSGEFSEWPKWFALFKTLIHDKAYLSQAEKMLHLQASVTGMAQHTISGMLYDGRLYEAALKALQSRFGREEDIVHANLQEIFACPTPAYLDPIGLERFHATVHCAVSVLQNLGYDGDLTSFENLRRVVEKLPSELKRDWGEYVLDLKPRRPSLVHFDTWIQRQVRIALNYTTVSQQPLPSRAATDRRMAAQGAYKSTTLQRTTLVMEAKSASSNVCICCNQHHELCACPDFLKRDVDERAQFVSTSGCCFYCLRTGHRVRHCSTAKTCDIGGCRMRHHPVLHGSQRIPRRVFGASSGGNQPEDSSTDRLVAAASHRNQSCTTLLQVVPVTIVGRHGSSRTVCALLDPGSQTSLCCEDILDELDLKGDDEVLRIRNVEGCGPTQRSRKLRLELRTAGGEAMVTVPEVFSVKNIHVTVPHIQKKRSDWKHLEGLDLPDCSGQRVELLLGANVIEAVLQLEVRTGKEGQPVAIRTAFGWTITGSIAEFVPGHIRDVMFVGRITDESKLCTDLQDWWRIESFGCKFEGQTPRSQEDARAQKTLEETTKMCQGRYEVGLLWKENNVKMPDNHQMAVHRLQSLERNLARDPHRTSAYEDVLMGYVAKNHARRVSTQELSQHNQKRWFLPHHAVISQNKTKVRVVFDAAAPYAGTSLNSALVTGPDLLQNLVGVLLRFREERVALVADVEEMFHQVKISEEDQPALSFLWRGMDRSRTPDVYQMMVVIFGAKCSPTLANYVLRRTAEDHQDETAESQSAAAAVKVNFYMDDFLRSEKDVATARKMQEEVTKLVAKGGFRLTKWQSNRQEVLQNIPERDRAPGGLDLACPGLGTQRALGCSWKIASDLLGVKIGSLEVPATKRGVLSRVCMIFDPLGLASPVVLRPKLLVQRLWALKYGWDDQLSDGEFLAWERWLSELPLLQDVDLPRCYRAALPDDDEVIGSELHIFCDASENAFGAVAYLRLTSEEGTHATSFVMSRTRLAPLRQLTIVRLELQAAVLGVRLANFIRQELSYTVNETFFWTDSMVVLQFIQNETRRFHTFVANRISEIQESSHRSQWRHVPSQQNPADVCSRGLSGPELKLCSIWWTGPAFLAQDREYWPSEDIGPTLSAGHVEMKTSQEAVFMTQVSDMRLLNPSRSSSWEKHTRTIAWVLRFIKNTKGGKGLSTRTTGSLTVTEIEAAELFVLKESQQVTLSTELRAISSQCRLPTGSTLQNVTPYLDEHGLLRARGRLENAPIPQESRHPIIISKDHDIIRLVVMNAHKRVLHCGLEHTLSEVRAMFWIPRARSMVKKILRECVFCRNRRARPQAPLMADLPETRFGMSRPFECAGIDYFGPLTTKKFRKTEKRYVLLVTCLSTRAVHLELVNSMDTDGFLMALRRFIARRGKPRVIMSDNGTNLTSGERELRSCLENWNQTQIADELTQKHIQWKFNPPTASHMGGVWERLVASVKRALRVVLGVQCVAEDVLHTVLVETEFALNSRPITYVSSDINDPEPLTPNHFVMGQPEAAFPPGVFSDSEVLGRRKWRQSQALANQVWRRWQKEYLPSLIERKKWLRDTRNLHVDDVVLMVEEGSPRGFWPLARVIEVTPSDDGVVRSVWVRTSGGSKYRRPVHKLCLIEKTQQADARQKLTLS